MRCTEARSAACRSLLEMLSSLRASMSCLSKATSCRQTSTFRKPCGTVGARQTSVCCCESSLLRGNGLGPGRPRGHLRPSQPGVFKSPAASTHSPFPCRNAGLVVETVAPGRTHGARARAPPGAAPRPADPQRRMPASQTTVVSVSRGFVTHRAVPSCAACRALSS